MVAETVAAAHQETASAVPPIPTSTRTLRPPTQTATATVAGGASGSILTKHDDGSTLFEDQRAGYELVVPAGWLPVRVNEPEFLDARKLPETADPAIQNALASVATEDPDPFRLFVVDTQEGHIQYYLATTVKFLWDENDDMSLVDEADLVELAQIMPSDIPGLQVLTAELRDTSNGVRIGEITSLIPALAIDGSVFNILQKQVFVQMRQGTLVITLSTIEEFIMKDAILDTFDAMIETLAISN